MNIDMNYYQERARATAIYPDLGKNLWYPSLGLAGEAGEVADKVKKVYRDHSGVLTPEQKNAICLELGDALWYIANIAAEMELSLSEVAHANLLKLSRRASQNQLHGEGDNR